MEGYEQNLFFVPLYENYLFVVVIVIFLATSSSEHE